MPVPALRHLRWLLALALCLQSALAIGHCLRLAGASPHQPLRLVVCTADGTITVGATDPQDPSDAPEQAAPGICLACHLATGGAVPPPPAVPLPRLVAALAPPLPAPDGPALGARAPPYPPTGPPRHA